MEVSAERKRCFFEEIRKERNEEGKKKCSSFNATFARVTVKNDKSISYKNSLVHSYVINPCTDF